MQILTAPNEILTTRSTDVVNFDMMKTVFNEMVQTAEQNGLIGLAANQLGFTNRFFIVDMGEGEFKMFINPKIKMNVNAGTDFLWEGCGSILNTSCLVKRFKSLTVTAQDVEGKAFTMTLSGKIARRVQHENDHLNGVLITSKARETRHGK